MTGIVPIDSGNQVPETTSGKSPKATNKECVMILCVLALEETATVHAKSIGVDVKSCNEMLSAQKALLKKEEAMGATKMVFETDYKTRSYWVGHHGVRGRHWRTWHHGVWKHRNRTAAEVCQQKMKADGVLRQQIGGDFKTLGSKLSAQQGKIEPEIEGSSMTIQKAASLITKYKRMMYDALKTRPKE